MSKKSKEEIVRNRIKMGVKISTNESRYLNNSSYDDYVDEENEKVLKAWRDIKKKNNGE